MTNGAPTTDLKLKQEHVELLSHYIKKGVYEEAAYMQDFPQDYTPQERAEGARKRAIAIGYADFLVLTK